MPPTTTDDVQHIGAELVSLREDAEASASRQLLPALASSLSYDNWLKWKREQGQGREVAIAGVPVEEPLRQSEQQVRNIGGRLTGANSNQSYNCTKYEEMKANLTTAPTK
jgi:hypothetical protein